jgi:hypothetical protein
MAARPPAPRHFFANQPGNDRRSTVTTRKCGRRNSILILAAGALAVSTLIDGESRAQPVGENLVAAVPEGFKVGYQTAHDQMSMQEWIPQSESVENWTQMVTVQVFHANKAETPYQFLQNISKRWLQTCAASAPANIVNGQANGYAVSMLLLRCPLNPTTKKPETTAIRVIRGTDGLYSVQQAFRFDPPKEKLAEAMLYLGNVNVCDTRQAEHPCPNFKTLGAQQ